MFQMQNGQTPATPAFSAFAARMQRLGETFTVRDVMVQLPDVVHVPIGDLDRAAALVETERFSVVPESEDDKTVPRVYCTVHPVNGDRVITEERETTIADYIPDATPLAEAFLLFDEREWYLTLHANQVAGLITYWEFNRHEFRVQLYTMLSLVEGLSRDILARDGCGVLDDRGIHLLDDQLDQPRQRFEQAKAKGGGNRFVDELDFHQVAAALEAHDLWRAFLSQKKITQKQYDKHFSFTTIRNDVMHGRTIFPTYERFRKRRRVVRKMVEWIDHLYAYRAIQTGTEHLESAPA